MSTRDGFRVLIVDDNLDITSVMQRGLPALGIEVTAFNDSEEAIANYRPRYYDAIILDVRMPKMTGFQVARSIWKQDPSANICFFTAFEIYKPEAERIFPSLKTYCFVKKPLTPAELASHIRSHFIQAK